ncbi:hypothetical protein LUZ63_010365 [Rhynchospora breviuscula]|uniref:DUF3598 domain-containing protein n=1 Tax=Rhynchospora breviuscula TaxID=2022672 RepID=A0A9Q0CH91_9POAL|nr:hypothetical protein LUZ63_010365 [Rhynchospora breviuscula]
MPLLSANVFSQKTALPLSNPKPRLLLTSPKQLFIFMTVSSSSSSSSSIATTTTPITLEPAKTDAGASSKWAEFAKRVSGEWDGYGADFTLDGKPVELPELVVPEAYREWGVQVFDWQTQCPTLAEETGDPVLYCKLIKFYPTVGCEADAATRHSVEQRFAGGTENTASALGYDTSGSYIATWPFKDQYEREILEVEHCLVDPANKEIRVRMIQVGQLNSEAGLSLNGLRVFSEQWYGPFCDGEQLGACSVRESGFASTSALEASQVVGKWEGKIASVVRFGDSEILHHFSADEPQNLVRDDIGLVTLPKKLWSVFKELDNGETLCEVGWLLSDNTAITSRCILYKKGVLKEATISFENLLQKV